MKEDAIILMALAERERERVKHSALLLKRRDFPDKVGIPFFTGKTGKYKVKPKFLNN